MIQAEKQLKDFATASLGLFWQRQATFAGATLLAAFYINLEIALICYGFCQLCEFLDYSVARRILNWDDQSNAKARHFLNQLTITSVLCSIAVVQYVIVVALAEGPSMHMGPLFFLFAATLYVSMNNCQIQRISIIRLIIYSFVLVFIPAYDLWVVRPPLDSDLWKQLGIVLFVLYFLIECSRKFLKNYNSGLKLVDELCVERDRVAEAYKVQSQFVSIVSHELRTPLTSVVASLDLINSGTISKLPKELQSVARIGHEGSKRLATLIDDLLDFQKFESGEMSLNLTLVELGQIVREAVEQNTAFGESRGVSIKAIEVDLPVYVNGDPDRLMQVMNNVLSNAIKFSHRGGVAEVSIEKHQSKGIISVRDTGVGIPSHSEDIVFEPFQQVACPDLRNYGGTGLGMSITREILKAHAGTIGYTSELGVGTTFAIELNLHSGFEIVLSEQDPQKADKMQNCAAE